MKCTWIRRLLLFTVLLTVLLLIVIAGIAMAEQMSGKLKVTVVDAITGAGIPSVRLQITRRQPEVEPTESGIVKPDLFLREIRTNQEGRKTVSLDHDDYDVMILTIPGDYSTEQDIYPVRVKAGKTAKLTIRLDPTTTCRIRVLDAEEQPVQDAEIQICSRYGRTDEQGIAILRNVPLGKDSIRITLRSGFFTEYLVHEGKISVKGEQGTLFRKTVRLKDRSEWKLIQEPVIEEKKPILYLYSQQDLEAFVKLGAPEKLTASYPDYPVETGWHVLVHPDGKMKDLTSGRNLYSLYWEGIAEKPAITDEGFVIAGKDTASFLEEKLAILGLNEYEAEEFILYWLPQMQSNAYNYIRFETEEEILRNMPLSIEPAPDRVIRVRMAFTPLDAEPEGIREQELTPVDRKLLDESFFLVVEWGAVPF